MFHSETSALPRMASRRRGWGWSLGVRARLIAGNAALAFGIYILRGFLATPLRSFKGCKFALILSWGPDDEIRWS